MLATNTHLYQIQNGRQFRIFLTSQNAKCMANYLINVNGARNARECVCIFVHTDKIHRQLEFPFIYIMSLINSV